MATTPVGEEKSSLRHDEEADIALSPIRSQVTMGKDSIETASTSKMKAVVEIR